MRDRYGVPHIYADTQHDLFFGQGFVQAQDRLFQMDLWRRSVQGRLAEVLGANFIERDIMTRRVQYEGDPELDWSSYGPASREIAEAFVHGINAWIALVRENPPEEFVLAGWRPEAWDAGDLLNRTDAFVASASAREQILRARLVAQLGVRRADQWLPSPPGGLDPTNASAIPAGLDLETVSYGLDSALRHIGAAPFFAGLAAPLRTPAGTNAWVAGPRRTSTGAPLLANDPHRHLDHPSNRYVIHLHGAGWNVIGAASPWLPGVAIGHNDRIAWGMTSVAARVQDLYVEKLNPAREHQVGEAGRFVDTRRTPDAIAIKGRDERFSFEREATRHGPVLAIDRERGLAYAVHWTGVEPGTAAELAAPAVDRARSWEEFRAAAARWKLPAVRFIYADVEGNFGDQVAALVPERRGWSGALPAPGDTGRFEWIGYRPFGTLPHQLNPADGYLSDGGADIARERRLHELFASGQSFTTDEFARWQYDDLSWNAEQLVPLLERVHADRPDVDAARQELLAWDRRLSSTSKPALLYAFWERALLRKLAGDALDAPVAAAFAARPDSASVLLVPALTQPSHDGFGGAAGHAATTRDSVLLECLAVAVDDRRAQSSSAVAWGALHTALFKHPLAVTEAARRRFDVGPFELSGGSGTLMSMTGRTMAVDVGASYRQILDLSDWDRSLATNAPGQSGSPGAPHFADLAGAWSRGDYFPLVFSDNAVAANAESTLVLTPIR